MKTKTKHVSTLTTVPTTAADAFSSIQHELAALTDDELVGISVDIPYAHQIALAAADRIDALLPELEKLPGLDIALVRKIRVYAAAAQHAHLLAIAPEMADPRLPAMLEEAAVLRENMLRTAELLVRFGLLPEERVAAIRAGNGHVDTANDLQQLSVMFLGVWETVENRVPITKEMVVHAGEHAYKLHVALGVKRVGELPSPDDPQRTRQRAYTLFVRAWEECRRGIAFLRARHGDADVIAPSIYVKQRRRSGAAQIEEPDAPTEPAPPAPIVTPEPIVEPAPNV